MVTDHHTCKCFCSFLHNPHWANPFLQTLTGNTFLQTAEGLRLRCLEAQELISHLQAFSCHSAGEDFSKLPPIFTNDATLAEAAVSSNEQQ
jgi:hypothetical protein